MDKRPVSPCWFEQLRTCNLADHFQWLFQLRASVDNVVSFGCFSSEPFALLWALDAATIKVVEMEKKSIDEREEERGHLIRVLPDALAGRSIELILAKMLSEEGIYRWPDCQFDLAYSEAFLKYVFKEDGLSAVEEAVAQMARVVKPGGWVIAVEAITEDQLTSIDISEQFRQARLLEVPLDGIPEFAYCYRKPSLDCEE